MLEAQRAIEAASKQMVTELQHDAEEVAERELAALRLVSDPLSTIGSLSSLMSTQLRGLSQQKEVLVRSAEAQRKIVSEESRRVGALERVHERTMLEERRAAEEVAVERVLETVLGRKKTSLP